MFERQSFPIISNTSLKNIANSHSLRCDSRQFEQRFFDLDNALDGKEICYLGEFLPDPIVKGTQPSYLQEGEGIPVINTLSIQKMNIYLESCRYISEEDFEDLTPSRVLKINDVLLTMDGGTSIGKPVLFTIDGDFTVDSHVAILRPQGITPKALVYLLASPLGQLQFQKFESGASGQTAVTEEDLRRFRIPTSAILKLEKEVEELDREKVRIDVARSQLNKDEEKMWYGFTSRILK